MHSDDGIVLRLPDTTGEPPEADLAVLDPDDVEREVTAEVGTSALFASRFRECAARALLLPRRDPRRRTPLWQQRQRAAQLLSVASEFASFPITLEAAREVLQDVYDVPGLVELMRDVRVPPRCGWPTCRPTPPRRSPSRCCSATSASSSTRATPRWPSAAPRPWPSTPACSPSCWAGPSCASCSTATRWPRSSPSCSGCPQQRHPARRRRRLGPAARARRPHRRRGGRPRRAGGVAGRAGRRPARAAGAHRRRGAARRHRGRRPAPRRAGHRAAGGRARGLHRAGRRSARRPRRPVRPHPRPVPAAARWPPGSGLGVAVVTATLQRLTGTGRLVVRRVPARAAPAGVVRRRGAALDPPAQPGQAAPGGRARTDRHAGPLHAVLAGRRRAAARHRRRPRRRRAAGRRARPGQRAGVARAPRPGARLLPRHARRADQRRRGAVGRRRRAARRRRLDQPRAGRPRRRCCCPSRWSCRRPAARCSTCSPAARRCSSAACPTSSARPTTPRWPTWSGTSSGPAR